jgi:membrane protein YdbS with pleckstrin-like domain
MPDYLQGKLAYTESEILGGQIHQAVMYRPILITLAGLLAFFLVIPRVPVRAAFVGDAMVVAMIGLFGWLAWKWVEWSRSLFFFTPYRIIYVHGIITRTIAMLPMGKVTDLKYDRTPAGQFLDYGKFIIESAGQEQALRELNYVPEPDETYKQIVDWLFGKGTTNVNIIDVNMTKQEKGLPVFVRNTRGGASGGGSTAGGRSGSTTEGERRQPWWTERE